jgi:hypothetical protein
VLAGIVAYPMEKAKEALCRFRDLTADAPDELASDIVLITMPDGTPVVGMVVCYTGPIQDGERILKPLKTFSPLLMDSIGTMPYTSAQKLVDDFYPKGLQNYWKSSFIEEISDEVIDIIAHYCANCPSPMCHGLIEHQLGGEVGRVGREETAFNHRDLEFSFMSIAQCADASEAEACAYDGRANSGMRCSHIRLAVYMLTIWAEKLMKVRIGLNPPTALINTSGSSH